MDTAVAFRGSHNSLLWTQLNVDTSYQRDLSPSKVNLIVRLFDSDAFGELVVSQRADGTYWIIDGQHRWKAMQKLGWTDQLMPCHIIPNLTAEEEARLYDLFNGNRGMPRISDRFKARVRYNDPEAIRILKTVHDAGFTVFYGRGHAPKATIGAINALLRIERYGKPGDLMKVLTIVNEAWGEEEPASFKGDLLLAMHRFTSRYRDQFDISGLIDKLKGTSPKALHNRGRQIADVMGCAVSVGVSQAILQHYNKNRRSGKLPEWSGDTTEDASEI